MIEWLQPCEGFLYSGTESKQVQKGRGHQQGRGEEEEGEKMQANPAYLPIEMSYKSQESKYINVSS